MEENGIKRSIKEHPGCKFNSVRDFIDYSITYYCPENLERIQNIFSKAADDIGQILEEDRKLYKERGGIPEEERPTIS